MVGMEMESDNSHAPLAPVGTGGDIETTMEDTSNSNTTQRENINSASAATTTALNGNISRHTQATTEAPTAESGATATTNQDDNRGQDYGGNLLELAQFLTMFRSYYEYGDRGRNDQNERGPSWEDDVVTPADIEAGLEYRYLLQEKQHLYDERDTLVVDDETEGDVTGKGGASQQNRSSSITVRKETRRGKYLKERLQEKEEQLKRPNNLRGKQMHELLQRFEVWSTKDVAHTLFMPPCDCENIDEAKNACWSNLLHIPSAAYFSSRLPEPQLEDAMNKEATKNAESAGKGNQLEGGLSEPTLVQEKSNGSKSKSTIRTQVSPTLFSSAYRKAHNAMAKHPMCSLIVPPNIYTWEEYARIAEMISESLHTKKARVAAANSPCAGATNTIQASCPSIYILRNRSGNGVSTVRGTGNKVNIYAVDFNFQPHDLVALWVRAQHDMTAWRHLVQLFTCHTDSETNRDHKERDNEEERDSYQLKFVGNHKSTKRRVLAESALVEKLREWATLNHVFFHYHFVRHQMHLARAISTPVSKRRNHGNGNLDSSSPPLAKRMRGDGNSVSTPGKAPATVMLEACYRYLLRWFCRRNQEKLAIIFSTDQTLNSVAQNSHYDKQDFAFFEQCKNANLADAICKRLKDFASSGSTAMNSCRSFARLDRWIRKGKFAPQGDESMGNDDKKTSFYLAVSALLRAWKECVSAEASITIDESELNSVVDDFDRMYAPFQKIFREDGIYAAAASLLEFDSSHDTNSEMSLADVTDGEVVKQLLAISTPWNEMCCQCKKACSQHQGQSAPTSCACCERLFHSDCYKLSNFKQTSVGDLGKQILPIDLFSVEVPHTDSVADFSGSNASKICWIDITLALRRPFDENGKMERLGISLRQTEACVEAFKYVKNSGSLSLEELFDENLLDVQYPLGFDREIAGFLVINVTEGGPGDRAGIKLNDILIGVDNLQGAGMQRFAGLGKKERLDLMMKSEEVKLEVRRSNMDFTDHSKEWLKEVRRHNECLFLLSKKTISVCSECKCERATQPFSEQESETEKIRMDAMHARAVIRRIGMESYAAAFQGEDAFSGIPRTSQNADPIFVSLRRLDAMMTWILCDSTKTSRPVSPEKQLLRNSFFKPAWYSPEKERLDWAPVELEKNPTMLLLSGMRILLCREGQGGVDIGHQSLFPSFKRQRLAMLAHFIQLYTSWSQALPLLTRKARVPWIAKSCTGCFARAGKKSHCGQWVCSSAHCFRRVMETNVSGAEIVNYDKKAQLVGTSILVYPDDELLSRVKDETGLRFDSFGRPVEFLIAFYCPRMRNDEDEVFFLIPVMSQQQLQFLIHRLSILKQPTDLSNKASLEYWIEDSILSLKGVMRLSHEHLQAKIAESSSFFEKAGKMISKMERQTVELAEPPSFCVLSASKDSGLVIGKSDVQTYVGGCVDRCSRILRCMLGVSTPTLRLMIDELDKSRDTSNHVLQEQSNSSNCSEDICAWSGKHKIGPDFENMEMETNGAEGIPALNIECFCMPTGVAPYTLVYSDLYGTSVEERQNLDRILGDTEEPNSSVSGDQEQVSIERIVLIRPNTLISNADQDEYSGVGWGMEMIKCSLDRRIRVSRVHPNSPAARCGIKPRDCILEINGRSCDGRTRWTLPFFISSILASSFDHSNRCQKKAGSLQIMSDVLKTLRSPVSGPVVITVQRPIPSKKQTFESLQMPPVEPSTITRKQGRALCSSVEQDDFRRVVDVAVGTTAISTPRQSTDNLIQPVAAAQNNSDGTQPSLAVVKGNTRTARAKTDTCVQEMQQMIMGYPGMKALKSLSGLVKSSLEKREILKASQLYEASKVPSTVLTQIEAAVIMEGINREMPMMGIRLVCPRYSLQTIVRQVICLEAHAEDYLETVPRLETSLWDRLLHCDFKRFEKEPEDAPKVFSDRANLSFAMPTEKLPLDRMGEEHFRKLAAKKKMLEEQQNRAQQHTSQITGQQQQLLLPGQPPIQANARLSQPQIPMQQRLVHMEQLHYRAPNQINQIQQPVQHHTYNGQPGVFQTPLHQVNVPPPPAAQGNTYRGGYIPSERIRGGGGEPSLSETEIPLENHPLNEWNNTLVYYDNDNEEIWGYIRAPIEILPPTVADIEVVPVAFFYGTKRGVFADPLNHVIDPLDLTVINNNNDRAQQAQKISMQFGVLQKLAAKENGPCDVDKKKQQQEQQTEEEVSENVGIEKKAHEDLGVIAQENTASQIEALSHSIQAEQGLPRLATHQPFHDATSGCPVTSHLPVKYRESSKKLIHQLLGEMGGPLSPLGVLVDGRSVLWLPTDPVALYVQILTVEHSTAPITRKGFRDCVMRQNRLRTSSERLISSSDATHCCLWGCTFQQTDGEEGFELAHFTEAAHLQRHNFRFHSFSGGSGESVTRAAPMAGFSRIATNDGIKDLISGLTSAACARSALLCKAQKSPASTLVDPTGENVVNSPSNYKYHLSADDLCDFLGGKPEDMVGNGVIMKQDPVVQAALLLLKIFLLFDIDRDTLRLTKYAHESFCAFMPKGIPNGGALSHPPCCCREPGGGISCSLCTLSCEEVLQLISNRSECKMGNAREKPELTELVTYSYQGIGCAKPGSISRSWPEKSKDNTDGTLSYTKGLLLQLRKKIPPQLRGRDANKSTKIAALRVGDLCFQDLCKQLWTTDGGSDFHNFVKQSSSTEMLGQAFIVLLASFQTRKLPLWWSGEAGWSSFGGSVLRSRASLILHIVLCDVALQEYMHTAPQETPLQNLDITTKASVAGFQNMSIHENMRLLLKMAEGISGLERYCGIHESLCSICEDGGSLLCCEFCPGVVHSSCCTPTVPESIDNWCCDSCTASITQLSLVDPFS